MSIHVIFDQSSNLSVIFVVLFFIRVSYITVAVMEQINIQVASLGVSFGKRINYQTMNRATPSDSAYIILPVVDF